MKTGAKAADSSLAKSSRGNKAGTGGNTRMMNSRLKIVFPLVCVLLMGAFVIPVSAVEYNPGVSVGQWVKYGDYVVTTPAETVFSPDWSMIEVVGVSGKEVTLRITGAYMNGTAIPASEVICNIDVGRINEWQRYIIAADLNEGDKILNVAESDTINKTETRTILGASRSVNILNFTYSAAGQDMTFTYIYDKASGMNLEFEMKINIIEQAVTYTNSYRIVDTNIFDCEPIPEFQSWMILSLLMTATLLVIIIQRREHTTQQ
jgi:hypothetical protein